jgi:exodeoxyribonuclease III
MKVITWNCNMAFRKKASFILVHKPDILIIVECEHPDKLIFPVEIPKSTSSLWFGKNQHKGLAIFSYGNYCFKILDEHNEDFKMIIPIAVTDGNFDFNIFLIWAYNPDDIDGRYITQVWKAIAH